MKKRLFIGLAVVLAVGLIIWYMSPVRIADVDPADVEEIVIFDGATGRKTHITDAGEVEKIIGNLKCVKLVRGKLSAGYLGFSFDTTICLKNGKKAGGWSHFIINSADTVRRDPFFYKVAEGTIDYDYIEQLVREASEAGPD